MTQCLICTPLTGSVHSLSGQKRSDTEGDRRTAWVSEDPIRQEGKRRGGEVRDRVKKTGEEIRGEMGLSDSWAGKSIYHNLTQIFLWSKQPGSSTLYLPPCFNMNVGISIQTRAHPMIYSYISGPLWVNRTHRFPTEKGNVRALC